MLQRFILLVYITYCKLSSLLGIAVMEINTINDKLITVTIYELSTCCVEGLEKQVTY